MQLFNSSCRLKKNAPPKSWKFCFIWHTKLRTWAQEAASQMALKDPSEDMKEEPGALGIFQQNPGCQNNERLLLGTCLVVQWLRLGSPNARDPGLTPGQGTRSHKLQLRVQFSLVQLSHSVVSNSLRPHEPQHARPPCPPPTLESTQTHVHYVGDAIQLSHSPSSPSPPAPNLSQHQGLFKWVSCPHQMAKVLEFQFLHQSFQWIFRTDFF